MRLLDMRDIEAFGSFSTGPGPDRGRTHRTLRTLMLISRRGRYRARPAPGRALYRRLRFGQVPMYRTHGHRALADRFSTRLMEPWRTSPTANTPGKLVSN